VAKHTLHVPHVLFASWDSVHVCECETADGGTGWLVDGMILRRVIPSSARALEFIVILGRPLAVMYYGSVDYTRKIVMLMYCDVICILMATTTTMMAAIASCNRLNTALNNEPLS